MMERRGLLLQTATQNLGSLRTLYLSFQNRSLPKELYSLAEALDDIYSESLDEVLKVRLENFCEDPNEEGQIETVDEFLYQAGFGLHYSIDGMRHMTAQGSRMKDRVSQIKYGWKFFCDRIGKVITVVIVDKEEQSKFYPFATRYRTAIGKAVILSISLDLAIDSVPHKATAGHLNANLSGFKLEFRLGSASKKQDKAKNGLESSLSSRRSMGSHQSRPPVAEQDETRFDHEPSPHSDTSEVSNQPQLRAASLGRDKNASDSESSLGSRASKGLDQLRLHGASFEHDESKHGDVRAETPNSEPSDRPEIQMGNLSDSLLRGARLWLCDLLWKTLMHLNGPISRLLSLFLICCFLSIIGPSIVHNACAISPRVSPYIPICPSNAGLPDPVPSFNEVFDLQTKLVDVQDITVEEYRVPVILNRGLLAIGLVQAVIAKSKIHQKEEISNALSEFVKLADPTILHLMQHHAELSMVLDFSLGLNRWFEDSLKKLATVDSSLRLRLSSLLQALLPGAPPPNREKLRAIYMRYTKQLNEKLTGLIDQGVTLLRDISYLQRSLQEAQALLGSSHIAAENEKAEFKSVWALIFQQHRVVLRRVNDKLTAIQDMSSCLNTTIIRLSSAVMTLQEINVQVKILSNALEMPSVLMEEGEALQPYIDAVGGVIKRLQDAQLTAKARRGERIAIDGRP